MRLVQLRCWLQILHKIWRFFIHGVPHKPGPGVDTYLNKLQLADWIPLREVVLVRTGLQDAVKAPLPAVIGAKETLLATVIPHQPRSPMATGIIKTLQGSVALANNHHRFVLEVVDDVISRLLQLLFTSSDVPDLSPQIFPLLLHEIRVVITRL